VTSGTTVLERYTYDGFDRVTEHRKTNGQGGTDTTRYAYDPLDRTASRTANAGAATEKRTDFNYLGLSGEVLSEEIAGQVQVAYQYSPWGQRLSQVKFKAGGVTEDSYYGYNPHSDVETLRQFEREYRSRLKTYFTQQLEALNSGGETQAPVDSGNAPKRLRSVLGDDEN